LQEPVAGGVVLKADQAASMHQAPADFIGFGFQEKHVLCALQANELQIQPMPVANYLILFDV
jgi:hypothetical protein